MKISAITKKLIQPFKHCESHIHDALKPVIKRINELELENAQLHQRLQGDLFIDKYNGKHTTLADPIEVPTYDKAAHAKSILSKWGLDSDVARGFMQRHGLCTEKFIELSNS